MIRSRNVGLRSLLVLSAALLLVLVPSGSARPPATVGHLADPVDRAVPNPPGVPPAAPPSDPTALLPVGRWSQLNVSAPPTLHGTVAMTYDGADGYVLAIGGQPYASANASLGEFWSYANGSWSPLHPGGTLPPGTGSAGGETLVYDPADAYVIDLVANFSASSGTISTFLYRSGNWTQLSPAAPAPPVRWRESFAWDSPDGSAVMFGGCFDFRCHRVANDTWSFAGGAWTNCTSASDPPGRYRADLFDDPGDGSVLLYGGVDPFGNSSAGSWTYRSGSWTPLRTNLSPGARDAAGIGGFGRDGVYVYGGESTAAYSANGTFADFWQYSGGNWTELSNASGPGPFCCSMVGSDLRDDQLLLFGGTNHSTRKHPNNTTWAFPEPLGAAFALTPRVTDVDRPLQLSASAFGGTPPYSYAWSLGDGNSSDESNLTLTYPTPGQFQITGWVNDSTNGSVLWTGWVEVHVALSGSANVSQPVADPGFSFRFAAGLSNGTPPYAVRWDFGDETSGNGTHYAHRYLRPGEYPVSVLGEDAVGGTWSGNLSVVVEPNASATLQANRTVADAGEPVLFTAGVANGTPPYSMEWTFGDGSRATGSPVVHTFGSPGVFGVTAWVNDSGGAALALGMNLSVGATLSIAAQGDAEYRDVGQPVECRVSIGGGTGPFSERWDFGDGTSAGGSVVNHTYSTPGTYRVTVRVNDSAGISSRTGFTVHVAPSLTVQGSVAPATGIAGLPMRFSADISGGTPPFEVGWSYSDGGRVTSASDSDGHAFSRPGNYTATVNVTDAAAASVSIMIPVVVVLPLSGAFSVDPAQITLGQSTLVQFLPVGGLAPLTYVWSGLPPGCTGVAEGRFNCTPTEPGRSEVHLQVRDALGENLSRVQNLTVAPELTAQLRVLSIDPNGGCLPRPPFIVRYSAGAAGGALPYSVHWSFGDSAEANTSGSATHQYDAPGNYSVILWVEDADHATATSRTNLSLGATGACPVPPKTTPPPTEWIALGSGAAIVGIGLAALAIRWVRRTAIRPAATS